MSILATLAAMQTKHAGITGVVSAPQIAAYPAALSGASLPLVLTWPAEADSNFERFTITRSDRVYVVRLYVLAVSQGITMADALTKAAPIISAFLVSYLADPTLGAAAADFMGVEKPLHDSGFVEFLYAGTAYWGCEFRVPIQEPI